MNRSMRYSKLLFLFNLITLVLLTSCEKEKEVKVTYRATMAISPYTITFLDENAHKITKTIEAESSADTWAYSYTGNEGDILFVSARYTDPESSILVQILLDGKVFKERSSTKDTARYVTVSGTIPY